MMKRLYQLLLTTYLFTTIYTVVRYHIYGPVLWKDIFVFTFNKIIIFSAVFFLLFLNIFKLNNHSKNILTKTILVSIVLHIIFSAIILKPYYLKSFFEPGLGMSLTGNISLLFGSLAAVFFILKSQIDINPVLRKKVFIIFAMIHLLVMGIKSWLNPDTWYGSLVPITLIGFIILALAIIKIGSNNE